MHDDLSVYVQWNLFNGLKDTIEKPLYKGHAYIQV